MNFSELMRRICEVKQLDVKTLSKEIGMTAPSFNNLLSGRVIKPDAVLAEKILTYCKNSSIDVSDLDWDEVIKEFFDSREIYNEYEIIGKFDENGNIAVKHKTCGRITYVPLSAFDGRATLCIHCWVEKFVFLDAYSFDLNSNTCKYKVKHLHCGKEYEVTYAQIKQKKYRCPKCLSDSDNAYTPVSGKRRNFDFIMDEQERDKWVDFDLIKKYVLFATRIKEVSWVKMDVVKTFMPDYLRTVFNNTTEKNISAEEIISEKSYFSIFNFDSFLKYVQYNNVAIAEIAPEEKEKNYNFIYYEFETKENKYVTLIMYEKLEIVDCNGECAMNFKGYNIFVEEGYDSEYIEEVSNNVIYFKGILNDLDNTDSAEKALCWLKTNKKVCEIARDLWNTAAKVLKKDSEESEMPSMDETIKMFDEKITLLSLKLLMQKFTSYTKSDSEDENEPSTIPNNASEDEDIDIDEEVDADDDEEEEEYDFDDLELTIYDKNDLYIEFCNFEADGYGDVNMVFWVRNNTNKEVILKASDVYVDGKPDDNEGDEIGKVYANESKHCRFSLWDWSTDASYDISLCVELFDNVNNKLGKTKHILASVDFEKVEQSAKAVDKGDDFGWFHWGLAEYLCEYIKEMTTANSFAWIRTSLLDKKGANIFNKVCNDTMDEDDISCNSVYLGTIYLSMFESWLRSKGNGTKFTEKEKNTHYELVYWNLSSAIDSKYEILQIYSIGQDDNLNDFTLHYSFNDEKFREIVEKNHTFYDELVVVPNNEENLFRRTVFAINQERAATFLNSYKNQYGLPCSKDKLDKRIAKWKDATAQLLEEKDELEHKKLLATPLYKLELDIGVRDYNSIRRLGLTVETVLGWTEKDFHRAMGEFRRYRFGTRAIVGILKGLDKLGLRISDCDKSLYPKLDDYFRKVFVCSSCGKILDYENVTYYGEWKCSDCSEKEKRKNADKAISLKGGFSINNDNGYETVSFNMILQNNTNRPIKISVDDMSLYYGKTLAHGKIDKRFPAFVEDYVFPNTERAFNRMWEIANCNFQDGDYLAIYLTDKTNEKRYYFKYLCKNNSFGFEDFYECDI